MSIVEGFHKNYSIFGARGLVWASMFRLVGWPREMKVKPPGLQHSIYLRARSTDLSIYNTVLLQKEYDLGLPYVPETIIDAGANIGMTSIYFAREFPLARIIAVEPEPNNFRMLCRNVAPYGNITPVHAALWSSDGEIRVTDPDPETGASGEWAFVTHEGRAGICTRAITMRTLLAEMKIRSVALLKMDIEGAEKEVFESGCDWIQDVRCLVIELHDRFRPGCRAAVEPVMQSFAKVERGETTLYMNPSHTGRIYDGTERAFR
jgi:FkbM family methyltransferase